MKVNLVSQTDLGTAAAVALNCRLQGRFARAEHSSAFHWSCKLQIPSGRTSRNFSEIAQLVLLRLVINYRKLVRGEEELYVSFRGLKISVKVVGPVFIQMLCQQYRLDNCSCCCCSILTIHS